jgi:hypothetical protein
MEKKERIHTRRIRIDTYEADDASLVIEGSLRDNRYFPYVIFATQERFEPGVIHRMKVQMRLSVPELEIQAVKAEMPKVPSPECRVIRQNLHKLEGLKIRAGFTNRVRALLGKTEGCLHLTHLILSMSSAAVQGAWTYYSRRRTTDPSRPPAADESMLVNSCWMWREGGPFWQRFRHLLQGQGDRDAPQALPDEKR